MNASTHQQLANFIWKIRNLLRGPYKRNEYRKMILLRRFGCVVADTKEAVKAVHEEHAHQPATVREQILEAAAGRPFYNVSKLDIGSLLNDPNLLAENIDACIGGFSTNVREVIDHFGFVEHIARWNKNTLRFEVRGAQSGAGTASTTGRIAADVHIGSQAVLECGTNRTIMSELTG